MRQLECVELRARSEGRGAKGEERRARSEATRGRLLVMQEGGMLLCCRFAPAFLHPLSYLTFRLILRETLSTDAMCSSFLTRVRSKGDGAWAWGGGALPNFDADALSSLV